jgi:hypothetical protein
MHGPINIRSPNDISKWQMGFNSAFKGLILVVKRKSFYMYEFQSKISGKGLIGKSVIDAYPN